MANKKEFSSMRMVLTLVIITGLAGMVLAGVRELTQERIDAAKKEAELAAVRKVLPEGLDVAEQAIEFEGMSVYKATDSQGALGGLAVRSSDPNGYGGKIVMMVGLNAAGKIHKIEALDISKETPGLGDGIAKEKFLAQFYKKGPDDMQYDVKQDQGDVDAVTAATISSRAATRAIHSAFQAYQAVQP